MRFAPLMVGAAVLGVLACQAAELSTTRREVERGRVQTRFEEWIQRVNNRELDSLSTMYDDSPNLVVSWSDGVRTTGLQEHLDRQEAFYDALQFMNVVPQNPVHEILSGTVATSSFRYSIDMVLNDTSRDAYSGQAHLVWVKSPDDDTWRIHNQIFSRSN